LFLDELSLYRKDALESLRAPLEDGVVRIARSAGVIVFPCRFSLVAAMNPCLCGYLGDARLEADPFSEFRKNLTTSESTLRRFITSRS
jgi:predicted ATPase with chaperone activity